MNPYAAPETRPAGASTEDDIAEAVPPAMARVAGGFVALAGGIVALTGTQTLLMARVRGPWAMVPYVLLVLGLPHLVLGIQIVRARAWAVLVSLGGTVLLLFLSAGWLLFSLAHYAFSLYALAAPGLALTALVLAFFALGPCQKASAARARLRAQGMNLGI
jgi:hypothetical protein